MTPDDRTTPGELLAAAVADNNHERVARVISAHVWSLFNTDYPAVIDAIGRIPAQVIERHPVLRLLHPMTPVVARASRPFDASQFNMYLQSSSVNPAIVTVMQMIAARVSGDIATAQGYAKRLGDLIQRNRIPAIPGPQNPIWFFHHQIGSTLLMAGDTTAALAEFSIARQIGEVAGAADAIRCAAGRESLVHAVRGSVDDALRSLTLAQQAGRGTPAYDAAAASTERTAAAMISLQRMDDDVEVRMGRLDSPDAVDVVWPYILLARVQFAMANQRPAEALESVAITTATHPIQPGSFAADLAVSASVRAQLLLGDLDAARRALDAALSPGPLTELAALRLALHEGDFLRAHQMSGMLRGAAELSPVHRAELALLAAWHEYQELGSLTPDAAFRAAEVIEPNRRQLLATFPEGLIRAILEQLPAGIGDRLDECVAGLRFRAPMHPRPLLTGAEQRVLDALPGNPSLADLATALQLSPNTVKTQLRKLYRKLGVTSRDEAVNAATRYSLWSAQPDPDAGRHG